jgi:hypothetical protein
MGEEKKKEERRKNGEERGLPYIKDKGASLVGVLVVE